MAPVKCEGGELKFALTTVEYYILIRRLRKAGEKMDCGSPITNETYCMITVFRKGLKDVKGQFLCLPYMSFK